MHEFTAHTLENANPEARELLQSIQNSYGFIPNLFAYMAEAPVTVEAYLSLNKLIEKSSLTAAQAQVALLATSMINECEFCSVAHRAMAKKAGAHSQTIAALAAREPVEDEKDRALVSLTQEIVSKRGWIEQSALNDFYAAGFTRQHVFEVILIVAIKTLSNYINHLTHPEPNPELLNML